MSQWGIAARAIAGALFIACTSIAYLGYRFMDPYDRVAVDIGGVPPNTEWLCLIAETNEEPRVMDWYLTKVFPFTMHPAGSVVSLLRDSERQHSAKVKWVHSQRVGVLYRSTGGDWTIAWFGSAGMRLADRSWLLGGGSVALRIQDADSKEAVAASRLEALGVW